MSLPDTRHAKIAYGIFAFSCISYVFMKIPFYDAFKKIEFLVAFAALYFLIVAKEERKTLPTLLLFIAALYSVGSWAIGHYWLHPEYFPKRPELHYFTRIFIFLPLAFFINGNDKKTYFILLLATISLLTTPWVTGEGIDEILQGLKGQRVDFGLVNAQHTGMFFGLILIGCFSFLPLALSKKKIIISSFLILCTLFSAYAVYASQNRAITLALFICLFLFSASILFKVKTKKKAIVIAITVLLGIGLYNLTNHSIKKTLHEKNRIESLWKEDVTSISSTSIGARLASWKAASEWIVQSPFIGWGSRGSTVVLRNTDWLQGTYPATFSHMHSSYIQILTEYGVIGASIMIILFSSIAIQLSACHKEKIINKNIFYFLKTSFIFLLIINLTESYLFYWTGAYLITLLTAISLSYIWKRQRKIKLNCTNN